MNIKSISGFLDAAKKTAAKKTYTGRFTCPDVQWTGTGSDLMATFTITGEELADAAESGLIWTDQDVQRGIVPGVDPLPSREISLQAGYPDRRKYVFNEANADEMVEKLLSGDKLFLNPLIWNLRPGTFEAFWDECSASIFIYAGRVYLPDSHHRHQAILKATRLWRDAPRDYPKFKGDKQFKVELYFLTKEDEGNYFFDKNNRSAPTAKSKGYDLTTTDDLSLLAKLAIDRSKALAGNVNRVTDRLTAGNRQVVTLSTLREMMKSFSPEPTVDASELEGMALVAANFYDRLAAIRHELAHLQLTERRRVRDELIVDSAVMMHGYASLMRQYNEDLAKKGQVAANKDWDRRLAMLSAVPSYRFGRWSGDLFSKANPLWQEVGVVKPGSSGDRLTVVNTGGARSECGRILRQLIALERRPEDLGFLSAR
ncbi:DNA sulfur modification protein DndB [Silanimonas sp.]|uniref:DNA sulfur modification protein DndB n=1 Tax=Silanimonas sp. TaxID=1929290 RepID=UPI0022BC192E|nr:DNA sulfur modification protein DndB [Silanimonas sp.]MCZ8064047.1 hypothetical protein [Silanimonas sp.]